MVDGDRGWRDPSLLSTDMVYCEESDFCQEMEKRTLQKQKTAYSQKWLSLNKKAKEVLTILNKQEALSEENYFISWMSCFLKKQRSLLETVCRLEI